MTTVNQHTHRRNAVYAFVAYHIRHYEYAPTLRQISEACGIPSTSVVREHVNGLVASGKLCKEARAARGITLPERLKRREASLTEQAAVWQALDCLIRWDVNAAGKPFGFTAWKQPTPDAQHECVADVQTWEGE